MNREICNKINALNEEATLELKPLDPTPVQKFRQNKFYVITNTDSEFVRLQKILNADPAIQVICEKYNPGMYLPLSVNRIFVMPKGMNNWPKMTLVEFKKFCSRRNISIYHLTESKLKWAAQQVEEMKL